MFPLTRAGNYLGGVPLIRRNFEKVVIGIVIVSTLPLVIQFLKSRRSLEPARMEP